MNSSRMLSFGALGIALLITVPPKVSDYEALQIRLDHAVEEASTALLERRDFELKVENRSGYFEIDAHGHDCQLQIRNAAAEGYNADEIKREAPKGAQLAFAYRGRVWMNHPTLQAAISHLWSRLKWQLGVDNKWFPVIAIAAVGACGIETLPWGQLASVRAN